MKNNAINLQPNGLTVILFVGVNGVGKTTSIGKLAHQYKLEGKKVFNGRCRYVPSGRHRSISCLG